MTHLRSKLIHLAHTNPHLRKNILPLLTSTKKTALAPGAARARAAAKEFGDAVGSLIYDLKDRSGDWDTGLGPSAEDVKLTAIELVKALNHLKDDPEIDDTKDLIATGIMMQIKAKSTQG